MWSATDPVHTETGHSLGIVVSKTSRGLLSADVEKLTCHEESYADFGVESLSVSQRCCHLAKVSQVLHPSLVEHAFLMSRRSLHSLRWTWENFLEAECLIWARGCLEFCTVYGRPVLNVSLCRDECRWWTDLSSARKSSRCVTANVVPPSVEGLRQRPFS